MSIVFHGAFNARWLSPEDVARQFVPIGQYYRLVHSRHSLLLGPRGSGKTTLLKMLTRRALQVWRSERERGDRAGVPEPGFEAIYIPSDVRWSYELRRLSEEPSLSPSRVELVQRVLVATSIVIATVDAFDAMLDDNTQLETTISEGLIDYFGLSQAIPTFRYICGAMEHLASTFRGAINRGDDNHLVELLSEVPDSLLGHVLDGPIASCRLFADRAPQVHQGEWALCFDELEIAPEWLRTEVLEGLRSVSQEFLLKVTFSPLLPSGLRTAPEPAHDFQKIRLWNSHIEDARAFCEDLSTRFLRAKFRMTDITPDDVLGQSALAEDDHLDQGERSYARGSLFYREMRALATEDTSFSLALQGRGLDPADPYTPSEVLRDTFLRKVKPIVVLRRAFRRGERARSRKVPTAYAGKQAIYAMSEGNPRWLLGLLSDLHDRWVAMPSYDPDGHPIVRVSSQAKVLSSAARRFHTSLTAIASGEVTIDHARSVALTAFLDLVGKATAEGMLGHEFPTDPYGSFVVDASPTSQLEQVITKALEVGALIYVGSSEDDVPRRIAGSRFRLTFMLAPIYRLPFRNYREILLSTLLARGGYPDQMDLFAAGSVTQPENEAL